MPGPAVLTPKSGTAHDALQGPVAESWQGQGRAVDGRNGIASCFTAIPREKLMQAVEERISDQGILKLLRAMSRAGVMHTGRYVARRPELRRVIDAPGSWNARGVPATRVTSGQSGQLRLRGDAVAVDHHEHVVTGVARQPCCPALSHR